MSKVIGEFRRRYEVEIADSITLAGGIDRPGDWHFQFGFHELHDAQSAAERLSEDNRWVRVIDTHDDNEENN